MAKYYLELRNESRWRVALRIYRDDPRTYGDAASMEALKARSYESGSPILPAQIKINLALRDRYTVEETERLIEWLELAKDAAQGFDFWINTAADFERVVLKPWPESHRKSRGDFLNVSDQDGTITINYSPGFAENVRQQTSN